jgi:hypothetical protein
VVGKQKGNKDSMEPVRRQRLESLPGWSWDANLSKWEDGFSYLKEFSKREGHCRVSTSYKTEDGYRLGQWVGVQRTIKGTMNPERRQRLESLPDWSWDVTLYKWEEGFSRLKQLSERKGNCRVSQTYKTDDGYPLGVWVSYQRSKKDAMEPERRQRLESLSGWVWKVKK